MKKQPPSIFNDVLGPIMRGPSSSHTAASVRIGYLIRQFFDGQVEYVVTTFEPTGSLASTYNNQGTDFGLIGGILGMKPEHPKLVEALSLATDKKIDVRFSIDVFEAFHPNTFKIRAGSGTSEHNFKFISSGGGMLELQEIDDIPVSIHGDYNELLLFIASYDHNQAERYVEKVKGIVPVYDYCLLTGNSNKKLINLKTVTPLTPEQLARLASLKEVEKTVILEPILPVRSNINCNIPFNSASGALDTSQKNNKSLAELAIEYECARGALAKEDILKLADRVLKTMKDSVEKGLAGTHFSDRILGVQSQKIKSYKGLLSGGERDRKLIAMITAIMETKSAMGVIVAAPTAGSCGCLPGTLFAVAEEFGLNHGTVSKGLLAAGLIGVLIAAKSTFAAEECGCQAECGAASGMAAAGVAQMLGGSTGHCLDAAAIALQNVMGMVCDPVAERVEVPCLGKNIMAAFNAVASANMALCGFDKVIPLDETISAFHQVGSMLPAELRCTGKAGLSVTTTAHQIRDTLSGKKNNL